jgi:hypothetical protein
MARSRSSIVVLVALAIVLSGCTATRGLRISEVGVGVLELYLDEPADHRLSLADHVLEFESVDPATGAREQGSFELVGSLRGGEFLVVWEEQGHMGAPYRAAYTNFWQQVVDGIAVAPGALGTVDNARSYAYRVKARRKRYVFPFFYAVDVSDDAVTFGPRPRPSLGGAFAENGALDAVTRSVAQSTQRGRTVWRKAPSVGGVNIPQDGDTEADWREDDESFGVAK